MPSRLEQKAEEKCPLIRKCGFKDSRTERFRDNICNTGNYLHCGYMQGIAQREEESHYKR